MIYLSPACDVYLGCSPPFSTLHSMNQVTYIHDIPSVHGVNPMLPVALANIDFNIGLAAGNLVDHQHVRDARATAQALKAFHGKCYAFEYPKI